MRKPFGGIPAALLSALLFGASTPAAKLLIADIGPWLLAGLLYLGAGVGLGLFGLLRRRPHARLGVKDWCWLLCATGAGGIVAPVLLMLGLAELPGSSASLLINLESVFTALLAWFVFRENVDRRVVIGMIAIVAGTIVLSWGGGAAIVALSPALAVVGACFFWALDNNITRKVSHADALRITTVKGLIAGATNVVIALGVSGLPAPPSFAFLIAGVVGFLGYGLSLVLFIVALRDLGTARTSAYFSTAPFVGAALAIPLLGEVVTTSLIVAGGLMALGVWLHLSERHEHEHAHVFIAHEHAHLHDRHHDHSHDESPGGDHSHPHGHESVKHVHPHYPDIHHRHGH